jgi:hypothetical protein
MPPMSAVKTAILARVFMTHTKVFSQRDTLNRSGPNESLIRIKVLPELLRSYLKSATRC